MMKPLLNAVQLAEILGLTLEGLYKKIQQNALGIPYIPRGKFGGYRFEQKDVQEAIRNNKVNPPRKPQRLMKRKNGNGR